MSIRINLNQTRELLDFFGGEDADMTVGRCGPEAHSGPGLYAWLTEHPEEGSIKLDEQPQPDDADGGVGHEPAGWLHRQGNHTELSERPLDADEIARGWTQEPLYTHGVRGGGNG